MAAPHADPRAETNRLPARAVPLALVFLALIGGLVLGGCSYSHDGWFANPCPTELTVRTFYVQRDTNGIEKSDEMIAEARLRPNAVTKVKDAFQDANGFVWFIEIVGGPTFRITKDEMPKWLVTVPATACRGT